MSTQYWGLLTDSLNLNRNNMSFSIFIIAPMSMFYSFFPVFLLSFSSIVLIEDIEEMFVLDLLKEYTLSLRGCLLLDVEFDVNPFKWAIDSFIFWLILDWLDFSNPSKLVFSSKHNFLAINPSSILSANNKQLIAKSFKFLIS